MTPWSDFFPHVLPYAPGCPDPVAEFNLRLAAQDFCARTRCWRHALVSITTTEEAGVGPYDMPLPEDTELVRIEDATVNGRPIDVLSEDALPVDWRAYPNTVRDCIFTNDLRTLYVVPPYTEDRVLAVNVSLKPADTAEELPEALSRLYMRHIAAGALELILAQPEKPYTNPALAMHQGGKFTAAIAKTSIQVQRGHSSFRARRRVRDF